MNDPVNDPELETRVASAMRRLAESHEPAPEDRVEEREPARAHRWLSIAAVFALLAVGIGGLVFALSASDNDPGSADEPSPGQLPTTTQFVEDLLVERTDTPRTVLAVEEPWGRWALTETASEGARCFGLVVVLAPGTRTTSSDGNCGLADSSEPTGLSGVCLTVDDGLSLLVSAGDASLAFVDSSIISRSTTSFRDGELNAVLGELRLNTLLSCPGPTVPDRNDPVATPTEPPPTPSSERSFRFDEAIPDGVLAGLSPIPGERGVQLLTDGPSALDGVSPFLDRVTIASLDASGAPIGFTSVTDTLIPPSAFAEDEQAVAEGVTYTRLLADPSTLAVIDGDRVRFIDSGVAFPNSNELDAAIAVAVYVAGVELDELSSSDNFEVFPTFEEPRTSVQYSLTSIENSRRNIQVTGSRSSEPLDERSLQLVTLALAPDAEASADGISYRGRHVFADQPVYVEQTSPVDTVVILGPPGMTEAEMDEVVATLTFGSADDLDLDTDDLRLSANIDVSLQSDEPWGRWAMFTSESDGERCFGLGVLIWPTAGSSATSVVCIPLDGSGGAFPSSLCHRVSDSSFVLVVTTNPALEESRLIGASQHEFEGLTLTATLYDDPDGAPPRCDPNT